MGKSTLPKSRRDFEIAIFCALEKEFNAVKLTLDEIWDESTLGFNKRSEGDDNLPYTLGLLCGKHNVVLVQLRSAGMGKGAAASSASYLCGSYPSIRVALLVGICGGVPGTGNDEILLGDVVIASSSQVRQYDFGKMTPNGFQIRNSDHGLMINPTLNSFVAGLKSEERAQGLNDSLAKALMILQLKRPGKYDYPGYDKDILFPSSYIHKHHMSPVCICKTCFSMHDAVCQVATEGSCSEVQCDLTKIITPRPRLQKLRQEFEICNLQRHLPVVQYGVMGCGDTVVKSGEERNRIAQEICAIALEMESAGIFQCLPGIVIKSVCDYADSHKNKAWQDYASAVAAATTKALLDQMDGVERDGASNGFRHIQNDHTNDSIKGHQCATNEHSCVRYSLCDEFIGRDDALARMEDALLGKAKSDKQKRFVIHGMGGIGKTQLCLRFARMFEYRFWGIFLVGASSRATAEEHFTDISSRLGSPSPSFDSGIELLRREQRPWLLILDNADDSNSDLHRYFPPTTRGCILVTTRLIKWNGECHQTVGTLELREMDVDKSIDIFLLNAGKNKEDDENRNLAKPIVEELGCLPLALSVAAAPILAGSWQLQNYWRFYKDRKQELMEKESADRENKYNRSIFATFNTSRKIMLEQTYFKPEIAQRAIEILELCAFLHFYEIPEKIIFTAPSMKTQNSIWARLKYPLSLSWIWEPNKESQSQIPPKTGEELTRQQILNALSDIKALPPATAKEEEEEERRIYSSEALRLLCASGLGDLTKNGIFSIHPLIREWAQWRLTPESTRRARWAAGVALANTVTWERRPELWKGLYPHIEFYLRSGSLSSSNGTILTLEQAEVAEKFSRVCCECGTFSLAENLAQETLKAVQHYREPYHLDKLRSLGTLTEVLIKRREYKNAVTLSEEALGLGRTVLEKGHPLMLKSLNNYAITLNGLGRYEESEKMSRMCLKEYDQVIKKGQHNSSAWVETKCNLASTLQKEAKFSEATELMSSAYAWRLENLGERHPDTINNLVKLASILTDNGHIQEAVVKLHVALDLQRNVLGDQHPDTLGTMSDLGRVLMKLEFTSEAEKLTQEAIEGMKQRLGTENLNTLYVMHSHAMMLEKKNDYKEAENFYRSLMEGYKAHFHEDHPDVLRTMISLAVMIDSQGPDRYDEAEEMYMATIRGLIGRYGSTHPDIVVCRANLAVLLEKRKKFQVAEEMHHMVEQDLLALGDHLSINSLNCLHNFSIFLKNRGKHAEAEAKARKAIIGFEVVLGPEKRSTLNCVHTLAVILEAQDRFIEAWLSYKRVYDGYSQIGDSRLPWCSQQLKTLGEKMRARGILEPTGTSILKDKQDDRVNKSSKPNLLKRHANPVTELDIIHHANIKKRNIEHD